MKASVHIAKFLKAQGVTRVFEVVGGMITCLIDSIHREKGIELVSVRHEQAASFAADAVGRLTGVPGVAMATSGPGATNLLTGIGSCYFDSAPAVFITGQVNSHEQKGRLKVRQLGFQETDIVAMAAPVTKAAFRARTAGEIPELLEEAFRLATSGRPGPVLLDIPMDFQNADVRAPATRPVKEAPSGKPTHREIVSLLDALRRAERPLVLVGGGVRASRALADARRCLEVLNAPVVNSLMAVDALPSGHSLRMGMIGSYGNRWANHALGRSDLLIVLGSRLDVRQTGADTSAFKSGRVIFHVDCDGSEVNNRVKGCRYIAADLKSFFAAVLDEAPRPLPRRARWFSEIEELRRRWPDTLELRDVSGINPNIFMHELSVRSRKAGVFVADVGQHQMWAAQSLDLRADQLFMTSGGMGAMGFGLPAAIGAAFAQPGRPQVMIAGDGGFQLNIQELQTVVHHKLPLKMVVLNNECHGMVRQFQQTYFAGRYASSLLGYSAPDFTAVARAYGIATAAVEEPGRVGKALDALWRDPKAPFLLEVKIARLANVYPKMAFGRPMTEMEPLAKPIAMEGT